MTYLKQLSNEIHQEAKSKGFWDEKRETGTLLMLITSELAEALEADRKNRYTPKGSFAVEDFDEYFKNNVKDTFEDEIADTMIRLFDLAGAMNIDLDWHIREKRKYNSSRPHKHGKKY